MDDKLNSIEGLLISIKELLSAKPRTSPTTPIQNNYRASLILIVPPVKEDVNVDETFYVDNIEQARQKKREIEGRIDAYKRRILIMRVEQDFRNFGEFR